MDVSGLLDLAKTRTGATGDRALAKLLGVSVAVPSQWRNGVTSPSAEHAQRLADLAGVEAAPVVLDLWIATAKTTALQETIARLKKAWAVSSATLLVLAVQLEAAAICILCSIDRMSPESDRVESLRFA
jgi:transcriptional regulator with XRE-family HTH domain